MPDVAIDLGELHERQCDAYLSVATEILYGGAAGGGKSHLMRAAAVLWCSQIPGLQVYLFRRTYPDLEKNHMTGPTSLPAMLAPWLQAKLVRFNGQKGTFKFWNGATIHLCHCQYEKDLTNYQGAEIHVLLIDEITHWPIEMYKYLRGRVRLGGLKVPKIFAHGQFPRILLSGNPGGIGHNWVKMDFVDNAPPMWVKRMPKIEGGMLRQYVPAKITDNPTLLDNDPLYVDRLAGLGTPAMVKAWLDGDWNIVAGGALDDLWSDDIHMIEPFAIPPSWRVDRSFDWGSSKPFSVGWWACSDGTQCILGDGTRKTYPKGTLFRIGEWYGWNGTPNQGLKMSDSEIALGIIRREKEMGIYMRVRPGPADSAIFDEINGDSPAKIQARHGVRWEEADKRPGTRVRRLQMLRNRLLAARMAALGPGEEPAIYIFNTCPQFKRTVPVLPRDPKKPDDVDTDAEDHVYDEATYRILAEGGRFAMSINAGAATNG
jgi:hypothetical protein